MDRKEFYTEQFRVTDCDCDMNRRLTAGAFLRMAQQISTDQCVRLGMDDAFYRENHAVFLLAKLALQVERTPQNGEVLTLTTMPEQPRRAVYKRVTEARDEKGERVALLDSRWVLVDTDTRHILRRAPAAFDAFPFAEQVPFALDVSIRFRAGHLQPVRFQRPHEQHPLCRRGRRRAAAGGAARGRGEGPCHRLPQRIARRPVRAADPRPKRGWQLVCVRPAGGRPALL